MQHDVERITLYTAIPRSPVVALTLAGDLECGAHTEETEAQQLVYFSPQSLHLLKKSLLSQEINCIYGAELLLKKRQHFSSDILPRVFMSLAGMLSAQAHTAAL